MKRKERKNPYCSLHDKTKLGFPNPVSAMQEVAS
jgi:hypothetical protein